MYHLNNKQVMKKFQKIGIELVKGIAIVLAAYVLMATVNPAYTGLKYAIANIFFSELTYSIIVPKPVFSVL